MKNTLLILIFMVPLTACNYPNMELFTENTIEVKNFNQKKELTGTVLIADEYGHSNITCADNYLILFSTMREHFFYVYNDKGDSLGCFGDKGQGPNDLINIQWCGQSSQATMWINDVSNARLCAVNIEKSLIERRCVFDEVVRNYSHSVNSFVYNDSLLISERMDGDNFTIIRINLINEMIISEEKVYNYPSYQVFSTYKSIWRIKPDGSKMASAMQSINMINILSLMDGSRKSIVVNPPLIKLDDVVDRNTGLEKWTYYSGLEVTDNYIYALYMNQKYDETYEVEKTMEIHVFDWQGNAQYKYIIPQYIYSIAVDSTNHYLYGLAIDEKIYVYNLKE